MEASSISPSSQASLLSLTSLALHSYCSLPSTRFPLHLFPICPHDTHTHCPFQSPSSFCSTSPSLTGQYYIFQSVLCMIWEVDEAISRLPPQPLPPSRFSPCCLMFQFGGSKHSIRQINCLMHVISQTVYKRGTLCPPHPHTHIHPSTSLWCSALRTPRISLAHADTVYSNINTHIQRATRQRVVDMHSSFAAILTYI